MSNEEIANYVKAQKTMIDSMFSGKLLEIFPKQVLKDYVNGLVKLYSQKPRYASRDHETIKYAIGNYFMMLNWKIGYEIPAGDLDSSYRFDLMAQDGDKTIIVEVKPEVTTSGMGQVLGYMFDSMKKFKKVRTFLGTDIFNFPIIFNGGEITNILTDNARHGLGVLFTDQNTVYALPAELILA